MIESKPKQQTDTEAIAQKIMNDPELLNRLIERGHSKNEHVGLTPEETMARMLKNVKNKKRNLSATVFTTEEDYYVNVTNTLLDNIGEIQYWLKNEPDNLRTELLRHDPNGIIGYGFEFKRKTPSIFEYKSDTCYVLLEKPAKSDSFEDISIVTAYPMINNGLGIKQPKDLRPIVAKTPTYRNAPAVKQVWFDYISNNPAYSVRYAGEDQCLQIYLPDPSHENVILIGATPEQYVLRAVDPDPAHPTPLISDILASGEFPEGTAVFPFTKTVRDAIGKDHGAELNLADRLYGEIQKKLGGGPGGSGLVPVVPEPEEEEEPDEKEQPDVPSAENPPPAKAPADSEANPPKRVQPEPHAVPAEDKCTESREERLRHRRLPDISGIVSNPQDETQLGG